MALIIAALFLLTESEFEQDLKNDWKPLLKKIEKKFVDKIYQEAEDHNPAGDVLPDEIDDKAKKDIKDFIKIF